MNDPYDHNEPTSKPSDFIVNVPPGDHPITAEHMANKAIALISGALSEIVDVVDVHQDMAPSSACYVLQLAGTLADSTIEWMHRWPE
ncbi:hypothetical protein NONI108955_22755 [Nocardia ninae]|uniref:Uncharacterized protein n=1 Tax=Nocardia ninae NBRC 108245 TaxID=1210091 RepID=A0A511MD94_9NOCA|nr:hypothetical protein [Nocardia ninae]GEM38559.1 hypothetical protein NN4_30780 [Nocardia ninae NBRC 108245]